jgi:hypothetical protein
VAYFFTYSVSVFVLHYLNHFILLIKAKPLQNDNNVKHDEHERLIQIKKELQLRPSKHSIPNTGLIPFTTIHSKLRKKSWHKSKQKFLRIILIYIPSLTIPVVGIFKIFSNAYIYLWIYLFVQLTLLSVAQNYQTAHWFLNKDVGVTWGKWS